MTVDLIAEREPKVYAAIDNAGIVHGPGMMDPERPHLRRRARGLPRTRGDSPFGWVRT